MKPLCLLGIVAAYLVFFGACIGDGGKNDPVQPQEFISPDGRFWMELSNSHNLVDTNAQIRVAENKWWDAAQVVFVAPDLYYFRPEGRARLLWSKDSTKALVLDRQLNYDSTEWLSTGEAPVFLYDFKAGRLSHAVHVEAVWGAPGFSLADIVGEDFGEPLSAGPDPWAQEKARPRTRGP